MTLIPERPGFDDGDKARRGHQKAWGAVLGIGFLLIILARVVDWVGWWTAGWWTAILLGLLMAAHGWVAYRNQHVSPDTKGDGFYYLGLLFTFASLVSALIVLSRSGGDLSVGTINRIIHDFGIALVTTIVGLGGRVLFTMTQDSPGDITTHATKALENAINEMTGIVVQGGRNMEDLVRHLKRSADALQQTTDGIASSVEKADSTAAALAAYSAKVVEMSEAFSSSVDDFRGAVRRGSESVAGLEERLAGADKSLRGFGAALDGAVKVLPTVEAAIEETKTGLLKAGDLAVREMAGMTAQVSTLGTEVVGVRDEFKKMADACADGAKAATRSLGSVKSSSSKVAALEARLDKAAAAAVSTLASNVVEAGARMAEATSGFGEVGGHATAASKGLEGMKNAAVQAQGDLVTVSRAAKGMRSQLAGPGSEAAEQISTAATEASKAAADLNGLTDQLTETQKELYDIALQSKEVIDKLGKHTGTRRRSGRLKRFFPWLR